MKVQRVLILLVSSLAFASCDMTGAPDKPPETILNCVNPKYTTLYRILRFSGDNVFVEYGTLGTLRGVVEDRDDMTWKWTIKDTSRKGIDLQWKLNTGTGHLQFRAFDTQKGYYLDLNPDYECKPIKRMVE